MISIDDTVYMDFARLLAERIAAANYFNGSIECETPEGPAILTATLIVYRDERRITDVVPVWWEFHLMHSAGEVPTNFSWSELRGFLPEYF